MANNMYHPLPNTHGQGLDRTNPENPAWQRLSTSMGRRSFPIQFNINQPQGNLTGIAPMVSYAGIGPFPNVPTGKARGMDGK